jgi:hypothetical protein
LSYVVVSGFENVETGDLQSQGESIAAFATLELARAHFTTRVAALESAVRDARAADAQATFITWTAILEMPLEIDGVDEALEDLETIIEETESPEDPFGALVVDYQGRRSEPSADRPFTQAEALRELEAWLT